MQKYKTSDQFFEALYNLNGINVISSLYDPLLP